MKQCEVRAVKRQLESYQDLLAMAAEKDREALMLQVRYETMAGACAIRYDREPGGSGKEKTTIYNEIFSDQLDAERKAAQYRYEAERIRRFIERIDDEAKDILKMAYLEGKRYWEIGREIGYTKSGIQMKINRCLESVPSSLAEACGLL